MRAGVVAQRQLQHVFEEHRAHHLVLAVRQAVGVQRHQRAADDDEEAEADPGADQHHQVTPRELRDAGLGIGEGIDDAAEQDRFHEHRRGERQIGDRERPAQTRLAPEKFEHADVESNEFHAADIGKGRTLPLRELCERLTLAQRPLLAMRPRAVLAAAIAIARCAAGNFRRPTKRACAQ